jgi:signal transduction histidine kinase
MHAEDLHATTAGATAAAPAPARRRLGAILRRAAVDTLYLAIGLGTSVLAFVAWVTGVTVSLTLAIFVIGLPAILASAAAFRWCADLDRRSAALVLGDRLHGRYRAHGGERMLARVSATLHDPQTWRDLGWLVAHSIVGFAFGCAALAAVAEVFATALLPAWYWALPDGADLGLWHVDSLGEALLAGPLAIPMAAVAVALVRVMAAGEAGLARRLLGTAEGPSPAPAAAAQAPRRRIVGGAALSLHLSITALLGFAVTLIWGLTGAGGDWPLWVWFGLAIPLALHAGIRLALRRAPRHLRWVAVQAAVSAVAAAALVAIWALSGGGAFWPAWPLIALAGLLASHALAVAAWRRLPGQRERALAERVDVLTRTRRGALDVQAAELRRIERDLHDGAQARLVALSMQLGRAEERLGDQPDVADLVRQARLEAGAAIAELRDLARGIAPPVLADRGLVAAVESLGRRAAIPVTVEAAVDRRVAPVIESAAYFVVAEALTNAAKHAPGASALVTVALAGDWLVIEVADDGPGGADDGGGGLTGLRHRVEALDGALAVTSPAGGGTTVHAELPCGS